MTKYLEDWIGRTRQVTEVIDLVRTRMMHAAMAGRPAALDGEEPQIDAVLPPGWHWLWFNEFRPAAELGPDGHPARGDFLPPIDLPRRMWAGSRITFHAPLRIGEEVSRTSRIASVKEKSGRSGRLCFVTVVHRLTVGDTARITEEQDLVYRQATGAPRPPGEPAPAEAMSSHEITPDPVWLFRYSALTSNGHRIHYDADYVRDVEGYPGLVVHGPLTATLLMRLAVSLTSAALTEFSFRAVSPLFVTEPFTIAGDLDGATARLWAVGPDGILAMTAQARFA